MGQAKQRGTFLERQAQAIAKRDAERLARHNAKIERSRREQERLASMTPLQKQNYLVNSAMIAGMMAIAAGEEQK